MDTSPASGQKGGNWLRGIAQEIARSHLFFWWQHKEWFSKKVSLWELDSFQSRINDIERSLDATPGSLARLVHAIPLDEVMEEDWPVMDVRPELIGYYETLDRQTLFTNALCNGSAPPFQPNIYRGAVKQLERQLKDVLAPYGGLRRLCTVPPSDDAFVTLLVEEAYMRGLVNGEPPPAAAKSFLPDARRSMHGRRVGRPLAQVEGDGTDFLVTAEVERGGQFGSAPVARDQHWRACWDAEGADEVDDDSRLLGMRLPTRTEADRLMALLAASADERHRCGLVQSVRDFWFRDRITDMPRSTTGVSHAAIYLVVEERE
jgi:hypothetical protein